MLFFKSFIELSPAAKVEMPGILLVASQSSGTQVTNFDMNQPGNLLPWFDFGHGVRSNALEAGMLPSYSVKEFFSLFRQIMLGEDPQDLYLQEWPSPDDLSQWSALHPLRERGLQAWPEDQELACSGQDPLSRFRL